MAAEPAMQAEDDVVLFEAAGERLALSAAQVMEIVRPPAITRVPHSPPNLLGVANLRGRVLPVVSVGGLLGHAPVEAHARRALSWLMTDRLSVSLLMPSWPSPRTRTADAWSLALSSKRGSASSSALQCIDPLQSWARQKQRRKLLANNSCFWCSTWPARTLRCRSMP